MFDKSERLMARFDEKDLIGRLHARARAASRKARRVS